MAAGEWDDEMTLLEIDENHRQMLAPNGDVWDLQVMLDGTFRTTFIPNIDVPAQDGESSGND